jgi:hypothetical protein
MTKSPLAVARSALEVGEATLPRYSTGKGPQKFTQPQLLAILVLKEFLRLDYRGIAEHLKDHSDLRAALGLKWIPHYSTLWRAEKRLLKKGAQEGS